MVCATGIVTHSDWGPGAQEDAASINNILDPILCIGSVYDEVFRGIPAKQNSGITISRQLLFRKSFSSAL